ncbi:hypothetical protein B0T22DRAFT_62391 [Podospora appendiculata]|uniref:Uncharacterized protein n=1 Tax=Podospora appendiculata TaxID=314037 RepID=A0AAE1CGW8_9PEZI|nr:hypothetical protein B0T22DRAFT_243783 [Podospora appendiculata]KAK3694122.1 hypothetical protein B0T22DRAFT_62391 [Podospora appendiculata]
MSDIQDKPTMVQDEHVSTKPRRRGGCVGHCLKLWWVYLILLIVIVVIAVPVILLVIVPKIAQSKLDDAELSIQGIRMMNSQAQNFTMSINSTILSDGKIKATIDGFPGKMYLEDYHDHTPFAIIDFPATTADAEQVVNVTQFTQINDVAAFTAFNTFLLMNDTFRVTVEGDTFVTVHGIARRYPVTFKKIVTLPGLRLFAGTTVFNTSISLTPDERGNNFKGKTRIPNHSLVTFEIGNTTFHNYLLGNEVGTVYIDDLTLIPGDGNVFDMRATIENTPVLNTVQEKPYCEDGNVPFQLRGKNVTNHGQYLSYFADALAAGNQTIEINIGDSIEKLVGNRPTCKTT